MYVPSLARCIAGALVAAYLTGCSPDFPPPAGYVEACYGGDFPKHLNGARPKLSLLVEATQPQWPQLAQKFKDFGERHNLQYFDTSVKAQGLHMLNVHLARLPVFGCTLISDFGTPGRKIRNPMKCRFSSSNTGKRMIGKQLPRLWRRT
jgi:hypothetical protein